MPGQAVVERERAVAELWESKMAMNPKHPAPAALCADAAAPDFRPQV